MGLMLLTRATTTATTSRPIPTSTVSGPDLEDTLMTKSESALQRTVSGPMSWYEQARVESSPVI